MDNSTSASSGGLSGANNYAAPWEAFLYSNGIVSLDSLGASGLQISLSGSPTLQNPSQVNATSLNGQPQSNLITGSSQLGILNLPNSTALPTTSNPTSAVDNLTGNGSHTSLVGTTTHSTPIASSPTLSSTLTPPAALPPFTILAEGTFTANGNGDYDGEPANLSDDALIYAGSGFTLNGNQTLPVKRDAAGNPLRDRNGKLILVDRAVAVAPGYGSINANSNLYSNLVPPQVVDRQTVNVPTYADTKQQDLDRRIPIGTPTVTFNVAQNPLNSASDWTRKFPAPGTVTRPTVVRVTGGGLNIPANVTLSNTIIMVDQGDINFNGSGHSFSNVAIVAGNGNINLNNLRATDLSVFASGSINMNGSARFGGFTLLANGNRNGSITFNGATTAIDPTQNLKVVAQGDILYNGATDTRGAFLTAKNFTFNGKSTLLGTIGAKGNILFNSNATVIAATIRDPDIIAPIITAQLLRDTAVGGINLDRLTSDPTIVGTVTDLSSVVELRAGFDNTPVGNYFDILSDRQADGSFTLSRARLNQIFSGTLPDGAHVLHLQAKDPYGNTSSLDVTFTLDTTIGIPSGLQLAPGSDSGQSSQDKVTQVNTPTITGRADPDTLVQLYSGSQFVGNTAAAADGTWQITTQLLSNGNHTLQAVAIDLAGNVSAVSTPLNIVVDALKPQLSLITPIANPLKNGAKLTGAISGTGSSITLLTYRFDNKVETPLSFNATTGAFDQALDFAGIGDGSHTLTITATDLAGNTIVAPYTVAVIIDRTAPVITAQLIRDTAADGTTNSDRLTFDPGIMGSVSDANPVVSFRAGFDAATPNQFVDVIAKRQADGRFSFDRAQLDTIYGSPLLDGAHTLKLQAKDEFGNLSEVFTLAFTLDTTAPNAPSLDLPAPSDTGSSDSDNITRTNAPTIAGTSEAGSSVQLYRDGVLVGETASNGNWQIVSSQLPDGTYRFTAKAIDAAGNMSDMLSPLSVTIDSAAPQLMLTQAIDTAPLKQDARLRGSVDGTGSGIAAISYRFNNGMEHPIALSSNGGFDQAIDFTGISNGTYTLTLTTTDVAGNGTTAAYNVVVAQDFAAPTIAAQLIRDTAPGNTTNTDKITFDPSISGLLTDASAIASFKAKFNNATTFTDVLVARQADGRFSFDRAQLEQIYGGILPDRTHTLYLQSADQFGNLSPLFGVTFTLDTTAPATVFNLDPNFDTAPVGDRQTVEEVVTLVGQTEANAIVHLQQTHTTVTADAVGRFTFSGVPLDLGTNLFSIRSTDPAGNESFATQTIIRQPRDTAAPIIAAALINDTAIGGTNTDKITADPAITGTITDMSRVSDFRAGFDSTAIASFTNVLTRLNPDGSFSFSRSQIEAIYGGAIPDGAHTLQLQAKDEYGNLSGVFEFNFILDTTAPIAPAFNLHAASDTGMVGDFKTGSDTVTLVGQTEANAAVTLAQTGATTTADATGRFTFGGIALAIGSNSFQVNAIDVAGNQSNFSTMITRLSPPIALSLSHSTVAENSAGGTVIGQLSTIDPDAGDSHVYTLVDNGGDRFEIVGDILQVKLGASLDFETTSSYPIEVRSTDADGLSKTQRFTISLTNVNEAPTFTSTPILTAQEGTDYRYRIVTTDPDSGDSRTISADRLPSWLTLTDNGDGTALLQGSPNLGSYSITLVVQDAGGIRVEQSFSLGINPRPLIEGTHFTTTRTLSLTTPDQPSLLRFKLQQQFDSTDLDAINDAFEVALVDDKGKSLVHAISPGRDAFFNWTEAHSISRGAGVSYDPQTQEVTLNLTGVPAGKAATLIFRLVNNDRDVTTQVQITDFAIVSAPAHTPAPVQGFTGQNPLPAASPVDFSKLTDVSSSFNVEYNLTSFNASTKLLYADVAIRNAGSYSTDAPLLIAIKNISNPSVLVRNPDGFTPDGTPYYNFSPLVQSGKFNPGDLSGQASLIFYNPNQVQFNYDLVILSQLNQAPSIATQPPTEVIQGQSYRYAVNATDPNQDTLTYSLSTDPQGMAIDSQTGLIAWDTTGSAIGNYSVVVSVSDRRGGSTEQFFTLSVTDTPPNRPPIFISTPSVDAQINKRYAYHANAIDPDQDLLTYKLLENPLGMTINPQTGLIEWIPQPGTILGDTVFSSLRLPGESDEYIFSGTKGESLYFDPLQYTGAYYNWKLEVYSPGGARVATGNFLNNSLLTLKETGNYRVVVSNTDNQTGAYGFSVINTALVPVAPFDQLVTGILAPGSEDDVYRFTGSKGQKLFFDSLSSSGGSLGWTLYNDKNQVVQSSSGHYDMELYLPKDGEYRLALQGQSALGNVVNYAFKIITPDEITVPIQLGDNQNSHAVYAEITEKGEEDRYTFQGKVGDRIYFDQRLLSNTTPGFSYTAKLLSPSGKKVLEYNLQNTADPEPLTLGEAGTYTVVIDATGEGTGQYGFSVLDLGKATAIALDTEYAASLEPGREAQAYQFRGAKGQRLYLDALSSTAFGAWTLYDSGNQQTVSNSLNTDIEVVLDDADIYTLIVQGYSNTPVNYKFNVITPDAVTAPLILSTAILSTLAEKGEQDIYTFTGHRGQRLFLDALIDNSQITATLISANGNKILNSVGLYNDQNRYPIILPDEGVYQLTIDGLGETTGNYGFQIVDLSAAPFLEIETPITDPTDGCLKPGSEVDAYRLVGTKGDRFYFDSQQLINGFWYLYSPANIQLSVAPLSSDFEYVLPGDGTYYLMLQGASATDVNYQFQVVKTTDSPLAYGLDTVQTGEIGKLGEQDLYTFTGTKGQRIFFDALTGSPNLTAKILNANGNPVYSGTTSLDGKSFTLTETGSYQIVIDGNNDTTGSYSFKIATVMTPLAPVSQGQAETLPLNATQQVMLDRNQSKLYKFTGAVGQKLWLDGLNDSYTYVPVGAILYSPSGAEVTRLSDFRNDAGLLTLPETGDYYLALNNGNQAGTVNFRLLDVAAAGLVIPDSNPVNGTLDPSGRGTLLYRLNGQAGQHLFFDYSGGAYYNSLSVYGTDGNRLTAQSLGNGLKLTLPTDGDYTVVLSDQGYISHYSLQVISSTWQDSTLTIGTPVTGSLAKLGQENSYTFTGTANQLLYFDSLNQASTVRVRLYSPTGAQVFESSGSQNVEPFALKENGIYQLVVEGGSSNVTGNYRFRLLDMATATPTALDTDITGSLPPLETQFYHFSAAQGQYVFLDPNAGSRLSYYTLYNTAGQQLFTSRSLLPDAYNPQAELNLPYSGEYILALRSDEATGSSYNFRIVTPEWNESPLVLGQTISGSIREPGERDVYTFTANSGQQILIDGLSIAYPYGTDFRLIAPSGRSIPINPPYAGLSPQSDSDLLTLTESGNYRIIVDAYGDEISDYSFRILDWSKAEALSLDTTITGNFGNSQREAHLYRFLGDKGEHLFFNRDIGAVSNYWQLFDAAGNSLTDQQYLSSDFKLDLPKTGEYALLLQSFGNTPSNYQFKVVTSEFSNAPLNLNEIVSAEIREPGEQDHYTFSGTEGQIIYLDSLLRSVNGIKPTLHAPSGEIVALDSYANRLNWDIDALSPVPEPFVLPESGNYTLTIDADGDTTGDYSFRLLDWSTATPIQRDETVTRNTASSGYETHLYRFSGDQGDYVFFDTNISNTHGYWQLFDASGKRVGNQSDSRTDFELALPQSGTYTLAIRGIYPTFSPYQFKIVSVDRTREALTLGQTISGTLSEPGEQDAYTFEGKAGQRLFLDGMQGIYGLDVLLYSPTGSRVFIKDAAQDMGPITLIETGIYKLIVDVPGNEYGNYTDTVGAYSFTLSDLDKATFLNFGTPIQNRFTTGNEAHLYQVTGTKGKVLNFDLSTTSWGYSGVRWALYDSSNQEISQPSYYTSDFKVVLPSTDSYTLVVFGGSTTPTGYSYEFQVNDITPAPIPSSGFNSSFKGQIQSDTPSTFTFNASAGTLVYLDSLSSSSSLINFRLLNPDGSEAFSGQNTTLDRAPFVLQQTGSYSIQAYRIAPNVTGDFEFRLLELSGEAQSSGSKALEVNQVTSGALNPGASTQVFNFQGSAGQKLLFNGMSASGGTQVSLYNANGKLIQNYGDSRYDGTPLTLSQNGAYYLVVSGQSSSLTNYRFQLLDLSVAKDLSFNVPIANIFSIAEESQLYKFNGKAGDRFTFDAQQGSLSNNWGVYRLDTGENLISRRLTEDFDVILPADGTYVLRLDGYYGTSGSPYQFRVINQSIVSGHDPSLLTPGTGEQGSNGDSFNGYAVKVAAIDTQGNSAIQEFQIRLNPDPTNIAPLITSTPDTRLGLNAKGYRYQLTVADAEGDALQYRLIDAPAGAFINQETGELIWVPDNAPTGSYRFTVEVADGQGGSDRQSFAVEVSKALGKIQGMVFNDLNQNGYRDTTLVQGELPDVVFVVDTSGSAGYRTIDWRTATLETVAAGTPSVLEMEQATVLALSEQLIQQGKGNTRIGIVSFNDEASYINIATDGYRLYTTPLSDDNHNGILDIREALNFDGSDAGTNFSPGLRLGRDLLNSLSNRPGQSTKAPNLIFISDGIGSLDNSIVDELRTAGVNLTAFGIGINAGMEALRRIDANAVQLTSVSDIQDIFQGFDSRLSNEPLFNPVKVYLDLNNNAVLDGNEPWQVTQLDTSGSLLGETKYSFTFDNLLPGQYTVRQVVPSGYRQTAPTMAFSDTVTTAGETFSHLFGLYQSEVKENQNPTFTSAAPIAPLKLGSTFRYQAQATDPDADVLSYDLPVKPAGMAISESGAIVWKPTQAGTYDVIVRVKDGKGGVDLQALKLEVRSDNHAPSFTSVVPSAQPQVGKLFQYQAQAIDLDGDTLNYSLVMGNRTPSGVTIDASTGLLSWRPTAIGGASALGGEVQPWQIAVRATDGKGGETFQTIDLVVDPARANQQPVITSSPRTTTRLGNTYLYQIAATDADDDRLTYSLTTAPAGMGLQDNVLVWTPTAAQFGNNPVTVSVSDGQGGTTIQTFAVNVTNSVTNNAPQITSTPTLITNLDHSYQYNLAGTDPDGDLLLWSLDKAPEGMAIDPQRGTLRWQPQAGQIGSQEVTVRLIDAFGSSVTQQFTLNVNGKNLAPMIQSVPGTRAAQGQAYSYAVKAIDPENDVLSFSLSKAPLGMAIDSTGVIRWTPTAAQIGNQAIEVLVTDAQGATSRQTFNVTVGATAINHSPTITSKPVFLAPTGSAYRYQVQAIDPDAGDTLSYKLLSQPIAGLTIDASTGLLSWDNPITGSYQVVVGAEDSRGLGAAQGFTLTVRDNHVAVVRSTPVERAIAGSLYRYDVVAQDPDGDRLSYSLDAGSVAKGIKLDELGRLQWTPTSEQVGTHSIQLTITDVLGARTQQSFDLTVLADTAAPQVNLRASASIAPVGSQVTFQVTATDNVGVSNLQLLVNGETYAIDRDGLATVTVQEGWTTLTVEAIAIDTAGNQTQTETTVGVVPLNNHAPIVDLDLSGLVNGTITSPTDIIGSVSDPDGDRLTYKLEVASVSGGEFKTLFEGDRAVAHAALGKFDPSLLLNDAYILRLSATDEFGNSTAIEDTLNVTGELKLGNFRLSFTDLSIPVTGIPISLTRTYDTLTSNTSDDFGYGWRMEFRDTDLRTSLKRNKQLEELGSYSAFKDGTKVFITLPGGKREAFTFKPTGAPFNYILAGYGTIGQSAAMYTPAFVSDKDGTSTLSVKNADATYLKYNGNTNEYDSVNGYAYNPADPTFGGVYVLTTKEGTVYEIDGQTGDLLKVTDTNGNTLSYTDDAISSSTGQRITFERDAQNRITSVKDPMGELIRYSYNDNGDLVGVSDRQGNVTHMEYSAGQSHYLDKIIDPLGRTGVRNEYDDTGRLKKLFDAAGNPVEMVYDPNNSTQTVFDQYGNATVYVYDDRGNVLQERDAAGKLTIRSYDADTNDLLSETVTSNRTGSVESVTNLYTYDAKRNKLSETDALGKTTLYTYGKLQPPEAARLNPLGQNNPIWV